jgi:hypothetical protein
MTFQDIDDAAWFKGSGVVSSFAGILGSGMVCVLGVSMVVLRFFPFDVCEQIGIQSPDGIRVGALEFRQADIAPDGTPSIIRSSRYVGIHTMRLSLLMLAGGVLVLVAEFLRKKQPSWKRLGLMALFFGMFTASPYVILPERPTMVYVEFLFPAGLPSTQRAEVLARIQTEWDEQTRRNGPSSMGAWQRTMMSPILQGTGEVAPCRPGVAFRVVFVPVGGTETSEESVQEAYFAFRQVVRRALVASKCFPAERPEGPPQPATP